MKSYALHTCHHCVVTLVRLQSDLLDRLELAFPQDIDLPREYSLRGRGRVDTAGLDGDDNVPARLQEVLGVVGNDTGLVGLSDIGEDNIHGGEEHPVFLRCTGVLHDSWTEQN